jgi:ferrochelatase
MAHGTPSSPEGIGEFYTRIRRGRPPTAEQLADLVARYRAIGGTSPLTARTAAQVAALAARLDDLEPGRYDVRFGAKHTEPLIEDAASSFTRDGIERVIGLVLAPQDTSLGTGEYLGRASAALAGHTFVPVRRWYDAPGLAELWAARVRRALDDLPPAVERPMVLFTAHSIPERVVAAGDTYPAQVEASAAAAAGAADLGHAGWRVAYQSAGRTPEPWLGPDLLTVLAELPAEGVDGVVVCPVGFVSDHLEILYDLDIEARGTAEGVGLAFGRAASLDDDPGFLAILAEVVGDTAGGR